MSIERKIESPELQLQYQKDFAIAYGLENGADAKYVFNVQNAPDAEVVQKLLVDFKVEKGINVKDENEVEAPADAEQQLVDQQHRDHQFASELNSKIGQSTVSSNQENITKFPAKEQGEEPLELDKAA
jgi:hypothetical protein